MTLNHSLLNKYEIILKYYIENKKKYNVKNNYLFKSSYYS